MTVSTIASNSGASGHAMISRYIQQKLAGPITHRVLQNFPPDRGFVPFGADVRTWLKSCAEIGRELHLYIAIPFCTNKGVDPATPEKCGFCLLPTVPYSKHDRDSYLEALLDHEMPAYAEYFGGERHPVDSIFLGGGTPNILSANLYAKVLQRLRELFHVKPDAEISSEGNPELYSEEKLVRLRELGFTRLSFGVQQFNDSLLRLSGRKATKEQVRRALARALKLGFSVSVDMIYGWPDQIADQFLSELRELHELGVPRITAYPLNTNRPTYFSTVLGHRLPTREVVREMFVASRELLLSLGYHHVTLNDYERESPAGSRPHLLRHEQVMRTDHLSYRIGFGYAAISKLLFHEQQRGITYRNYDNREEGLKRYVELWQRDEFPIQDHFVYGGIDLLLNYVSGALQTFSVNLQDLEKNFPWIRFLDEFEPELSVLESMGLLTISADRIQLTLNGIFNTHLVQGAFFVRRIQELRMKS